MQKHSRWTIMLLLLGTLFLTGCSLFSGEDSKSPEYKPYPAFTGAQQGGSGTPYSFSGTRN